MTTPSPDASTLARVFGDAAADDVVESMERHAKINEFLITAIRTNDSRLFRRALDAEADVNHAGGKPLQEAAFVRNYLFMKELMVSGADVSHAVEGLKQEQGGIQRRKKNDQWGDPAGYTFKNKDEKARYAVLGATMKMLDDYQKTFIKDIMPMESLRLQHETLREIRAIKKELYESIHGVPVNKPRIRAPKTFE